MKEIFLIDFHHLRGGVIPKVCLITEMDVFHHFLVSRNNVPYVQSSSVEHDQMFTDEEDVETPQVIGNFLVMNSNRNEQRSTEVTTMEHKEEMYQLD